MEKIRAEKEATHKIKQPQQGKGESIGETRRPALSKSGGQHERSAQTA